MLHNYYIFRKLIYNISYCYRVQLQPSSIFNAVLKECKFNENIKQILN